MTRASLHRPRATLALAAAVLLGLLAASTITGDRLHVAGYVDPASPSSKARERLHAALGYDASPGMVILARSAAGFGSEESRGAVRRLAARVARDPGYVAD
ncbi:MAG: hypothetical protein QOC55_1550, partial [Thermoleophilaceae bacterium]|nr:hypothetical protein [Thermoleophilaceae bacterium]